MTVVIREDGQTYDPIIKSRRESRTVNAAWLEQGETLPWTQRLGFAVFSFILLSCGTLFEVLVLGSLWRGEFLSLETVAELCGVLVALIFFVIPGALGLRNVLRFPK